MNPLQKRILHTLGSAAGGVCLATVLGYAGAAYGSSVDATGWAAIGYSAIAAILGFPLGVWTSAVLFGKFMQLGGSILWSFLGMLVGIVLLFGIVRSGTSSPVLFGIGALCLVSTTLLGYYQPWRRA